MADREDKSEIMFILLMQRPLEPNQKLVGHICRDRCSIRLNLTRHQKIIKTTHMSASTMHAPTNIFHINLYLSKY